MLRNIGMGPRREDPSLLGRLLDCHARIREMLALAGRLAEEPRPGDDEIVEAAERVRRYFQRSLRLHVEDEEESILPRLLERAPDAAAALERMHAEHEEHETLVASLVECCDRLREDPARWQEIHEALGRHAAELGAEMEVHLAEEEKDVFPRIASALDETTCAQIVEEMQRRRDAEGGGGGGRGRGKGGGGAGRGRRDG